MILRFLINFLAVFGLITLAHLGGAWVAVAVGLAWTGGYTYALVLQYLDD